MLKIEPVMLNGNDDGISRLRLLGAEPVNAHVFVALAGFKQA